MADRDVGKSSLSSDEYENNKVSDGGSLPKEHPDEEDHADDDDEDAVEQDVSGYLFFVTNIYMHVI